MKTLFFRNTQTTRSKTMRTTLLYLAIPLAMTVSLCGCGNSGGDSAPSRGEVQPVSAKSEPAPAAQPAEAPAEDGAAPSDDMTTADPQEALSRLFAAAEEHYFSGRTNEAIRVLVDALDDESLASERRQVFGMLVRTELGAGLVADARARMLDAYANDAELAEGAYGAVYDHYCAMGDLPAAIAWTEEVLAIKNLPQAIRNSMREWNFMSVIASNDDARIVSLALDLIAQAPTGDAVAILRRGADALLERGKFDVASRILDQAGRSVTSDAATRDFLAMLRLRLYVVQGRWDAFSAAFPATAASLSDTDLLHVMRRTLPAAAKARRHAVIDAICEGVMTNPAPRKMSYEYAARQWVASALEQDADKVPERIAALVGRGRQMGEVGSIFIRHAYDDVDDMKFVEEMRPLAERLAPLAGDEDSRGAIRTILLDYSFLLEDYDAALKLLEAGFPGYDKNWHDMATAKVKAHKALDENRPLDAIREFRAFMAAIQASEEDETSDPATGAIHTREMILGRNALRIGEIYASIPDAAQAKAAYDEARAYYQKALETVRDAETAEQIRKEMARVPAK